MSNGNVLGFLCILDNIFVKFWNNWIIYLFLNILNLNNRNVLEYLEEIEVLLGMILERI